MWLVIILVLAAFLRIILLDKIPTSITGDELTYILTAKSFLLSDFDISGTVAPWQVLFFKYSPLNMPQAELPYFLLMPFLIGNFSLFAVHLPFALLGVLLVFFLYLVTKELINNKVALVAAFFSAINPWLIVTNRTAYEMTPAMVFYILGLYILLKTKGWQIMLAFPVFMLAFYSYIATKLVFIPFLVLAVVYLYFAKNKRQFGRQYLVFLALILGFVFIFLGLLQLNGGSRLGDIMLPNAPIVAQRVDLLRKLSISSPLSSILINKFTVYGQFLVDKFFNTIASSYLYLYGDNFFGLWRHGLFYILDAFFLLVGGYAILRKQKTLFFFLAGSVLLGFVPQVVHKGSDNFTPHITFIFPFVIIFIAYGVVYLTELKPKIQKSLLGAIIVIYLLLLANFSQIYFYQFPIQGQADFAMRELARYAVLADQAGQKVVIFSKTSNDLMRKYVFYTSIYNKYTAASLKAQFVANEPKVAKVNFKECNDTFDPAKVTDTVIVSKTCSDLFRYTKHLTIGQLTDGGNVYSIYNDKLCVGFALNRYVVNLQLADFEVEKLSSQQLCQKFITAL